MNKDNALFVAPRTETERRLAEIWGEILDLDDVSVEASFFELGGDSLTAVHVVHHVSETLEVELPISVVFEFPTISELSKCINDLQVASDLSSADPNELTT
jgi:acyl carrier protein